MFADSLRKLRKAKKWTQQTLSKEIDVDCSTVTKWETGKAYPDFEKQQKLSLIFGVSIDYLMGIAPSYAEIKIAQERSYARYEELSKLYPAKYSFPFLERALGTNFGIFKLWCDGYGDFFNNKLFILAEFLECSVDYLIGKTDVVNHELKLDDFAYAMNDEAKDLSDEDKLALLNMAKLLRSKNTN